MSMYLFSFARFRISNNWIDGIRDDLCQALNKRKQLVTIFHFGDPKHNGTLEEAILDAVFNGLLFPDDINRWIRIFFSCKIFW
jgi:hypothetical protein